MNVFQAIIVQHRFRRPPRLGHRGDHEDAMTHNLFEALITPVLVTAYFWVMLSIALSEHRSGELPRLGFSVMERVTLAIILGLAAGGIRVLRGAIVWWFA